MANAIKVTTEKGEQVIIVSNIKGVERVPAVPAVPDQPAMPAVEAEAGVPADPRTGHPGKAEVKAQEAKPEVKGTTAIPETCIIHQTSGESVPCSHRQADLVDMINR